MLLQFSSRSFVNTNTPVLYLRANRGMFDHDKKINARKISNACHHLPVKLL